LLLNVVKLSIIFIPFKITPENNTSIKIMVIAMRNVFGLIYLSFYFRIFIFVESEINAALLVVDS
jgi:hypothetical protein